MLTFTLDTSCVLAAVKQEPDGPYVERWSSWRGPVRSPSPGPQASRRTSAWRPRISAAPTWTI